MECFIVIKKNVDLERRELRLVGDEAHHAVKSLRLRAGEELLATDLEGMCYRCKLEDVNSVLCSIEEILPAFGEPKRDILLVQGMISQPARWEFLLEKATELGVRTVQPVTTERTERERFNRERSERILRAAVKQTKRARIPKLGEVTSLKTALIKAKGEDRTILLLHEGAIPEERIAIPNDRAIAIVIGPEGGFSENEVSEAVKAGASVVSLGPRRLRAETAAIAAIALVMGEM